MRIFKAKKRTHMRQGDKAARRRTRNYPAACQMTDAQHTSRSKAHEVVNRTGDFASRHTKSNAQTITCLNRTVTSDIKTANASTSRKSHDLRLNRRFD